MKLFVSYRSTDSKKVDPFVSRLRSTKKYESVWQDKTSIPGGQDWWQSICEGIENCDYFLFMLSPESVISKPCLAELSYAYDLNIPIIPVVIEGAWTYNTTSGKYDIEFWDEIPAQLTKSRIQFLFYEGPNTFEKLEQAIKLIEEKPSKRMSTDRPPDPRDVSSAENNIAVIYDEAYEYAYRLEFQTARELFRKLVNLQDPDFGEIALEWADLIEDYEDIKQFAELKSTLRIAKKRWAEYLKRFPNEFLDDDIFDPANLAEKLQAKNIRPRTPKQATTVSQPAPIIQSSKPTSISLMPAPFDWIEIPKKGYSIAKYPVTNAQFAKFIEAEGYTNERWWTKEGWQKRAEGWHYDGGWKASGTLSTEPRYWGDSKWNGAEQPVVGVSWFEAVAFCLWLSEATGEKIMLPTEDQWQYAAQGDDGRTYPWGNDWNRDLCNNNVDKKGIGKTTPVTEYEGKGDSPFSVVDMLGNVWELCLTDYDAKTNNINSSANGRVLRGGSWWVDSTDNFRCDYRVGRYTHNRSYGDGFRLSRS